VKVPKLPGSGKDTAEGYDVSNIKKG